MKRCKKELRKKKDWKRGKRIKSGEGKNYTRFNSGERNEFEEIN